MIVRDIVVGFYRNIRHLNGWFRIIKIILSCTLQILTNPSYVMFSIVALGLGTMGIWIVFFPGGFDFHEGLIGQISNLSVFTFCVATLGGMATEYFFEERGSEDKGEPINSVDLEKLQSKHLAFFFWTVALLMSFYALKADAGILIGLGSTLVLWLYVNIHRPKFQAINKAALDNLNPNYRSGKRNEDSDFGGKGL